MCFFCFCFFCAVVAGCASQGWLPVLFLALPCAPGAMAPKLRELLEATPLETRGQVAKAWQEGKGTGGGEGCASGVRPPAKAVPGEQDVLLGPLDIGWLSGGQWTGRDRDFVFARTRCSVALRARATWGPGKMLTIRGPPSQIGEAKAIALARLEASLSEPWVEDPGSSTASHSWEAMPERLSAGREAAARFPRPPLPKAFPWEAVPEWTFPAGASPAGPAPEAMPQPTCAAAAVPEARCSAAAVPEAAPEAKPQSGCAAAAAVSPLEAWLAPPQEATAHHPFVSWSHVEIIDYTVDIEEEEVAPPVVVLDDDGQPLPEAWPIMGPRFRGST